ncbi:MAG: endonuclease domain-containing protein [Alphaproteobacteria bacterium]|nr:endonuclease domain-containing protein [Alphaproteobacteria bacterium]
MTRSTLVRRLRANPTEAEIRLWSRLRRKQIDGYRFRRQVQIGEYVVDFACMSARLAIEVDGGQHATRSARGANRTKRIEADGFQIFRVWNHDVLANTDGVIDAIHAVLASRALGERADRASRIGAVLRNEVP